MRSIEECKKEVLARSEEKIRHRKKMRNRLVAGLIPLCLCIAIFATWSRSKSGGMEGLMSNGDGAGMNAEKVTENSSVLQKQASVTHQSEHWVLSADQTDELFLTLEDFLSQENGGDYEIEGETYSIEIPYDARGGGTFRYQLQGNQLSRGYLKVLLSHVQLQKILMQLNAARP